MESKSALLNFSLWSHFIRTHAQRVKKSKVNYLLGFFGCFLVVFVVAVMSAILSNVPLIFLRLAELQRGETDAVIRPVVAGNSYYRAGYQYLNFTQGILLKISQFSIETS